MDRKLLSLSECEDIIVSSSQNYVRVGYALSLIRTFEMYKDNGCSTFESYVRQRFGYTDRWATRNIEEMTVVSMIFDLEKPEDFLDSRAGGYFSDVYLSGKVASRLYRHSKTKEGLKELYGKCAEYAKRKRKLSESCCSDEPGARCLRVTTEDVDAVLGLSAWKGSAKSKAATYENTIRMLDSLDTRMRKYEESDAVAVARSCVKAIRDVVVARDDIALGAEGRRAVLEAVELSMEAME